MTLQRFIVAYIYQPLSLPLSRFAAAHDLRGWPSFALEIAIPIFISFVLVGLWHGAGWTFIIFGAMHGVYLSVNEAWNLRRKNLTRKRRKQGLPPLVEKKFEAVLVPCDHPACDRIQQRDVPRRERQGCGEHLARFDRSERRLRGDLGLQQGVELAVVILLGVGDRRIHAQHATDHAPVRPGLQREGMG